MGFYWYEAGVRSQRVERSALEREQNGAARNAPRDAYAAQTEQHTKRQPAVIARQIMAQKLVTLPETATFDEIYSLLRNKRFRHVPIVDSQGKLRGIISDRDALREAASVGQGTGGSWIAEVVQQQKTAAEFMTRKVLVASPTTEIRHIAKAMFEERIGAMPIIDDTHRLVGLITRSDILRTLITGAPLELWI